MLISLFAVYDPVLIACSVMVFKISGYIITYAQARKLAPNMPLNDGLLAYGTFVQMLINTNLVDIVEPVPVKWPGDMEEAIMLVRVGREDPASSKTKYSAFKEEEEDRKVKLALQNRTRIIGEGMNLRPCFTRI